MDIKEAVRRSLPIPVPVIDTHTHLHECSTGGLHQGLRGTEAVVQLMDRIGIDCIVTSPIVMELGDQVLANRQTVQAMQEYPGRIYGNLVLCPHDGAEAVRQTVRSFGSLPGFVAVKLLTGYHGDPNRGEYAYAFSFAQECGCPVTLHYWEKQVSLASVERLLAHYPTLKLILAHQGGGRRSYTQQTAQLMAQCDRLYLDTCGSLYNSMDLWEMAQLVGEDRLVFGSDMLYLEPRFELGKVVFSGMPERTMKKIFAENYLRLLSGSQLTQIPLTPAL